MVFDVHCDSCLRRGSDGKGAQLIQFKLRSEDERRRMRPVVKFLDEDSELRRNFEIVLKTMSL